MAHLLPTPPTPASSPRLCLKARRARRPAVSRTRGKAGGRCTRLPAVPAVRVRLPRSCPTGPSGLWPLPVVGGVIAARLLLPTSLRRHVTLLPVQVGDVASADHPHRSTRHRATRLEAISGTNPTKMSRRSCPGCLLYAEEQECPANPHPSVPTPGTPWNRNAPICRPNAGGSRRRCGTPTRRWATAPTRPTSCKAPTRSSGWTRASRTSPPASPGRRPRARPRPTRWAWAARSPCGTATARRRPSRSASVPRRRTRN